MKHRLISCSLLLLEVVAVIMFPVALSGRSVADSPIILSFSASDLPMIREPHLFPVSFDWAPDSKRIAVEFRARHETGTAAIWVAIWQTANKRLINQCHVDELSNSEAENLELRSELRYSSDGKTLVVLTGPRIVLLSASDCTNRAVLSAPRIAPRRNDHVESSSVAPSVTIRMFDISANPGYIAFVSDDASYKWPDIKWSTSPHSIVQVVDLNNAALIREFSFAGTVSFLAMPPAARYVALTGRFADAQSGGDIVLLDVQQGTRAKELRSTLSSWPSPTLGGVPIAFSSDSELIAAPTRDTSSSGRYIGRTLKIIDVPSGKVVRELRAHHFGPLGTLAVASHAPIVASISFWESPRQVLSDYGPAKTRSELIVFRLTDGKSYHLGRPLLAGAFSFTLDQFAMRLSPDGSVAGLFQGNQVSVYEIPPAILDVGKNGSPSK